MKTKQELLEMLFSRLAELQCIKDNPLRERLTLRLRTELSLLYNILGDDVPEEYQEEIEELI